MESRAVHAALWRRLAYAGARYGPRPFVRLSPPVLGAAFGVALPGQRQRVRRNLQRVLPDLGELGLQRAVLRTFSQYACCLAESFATERADAQDTTCVVHDQERLLEPLRSAQGLVVVTAHVGPWEIAAGLLAAELGADVMVAMAPEPDIEARRFHDAVRARAGVTVAHVGQNPFDALPLLRHLRAGGVAAFQLDRRLTGARSVTTSLFGAPFNVPEGPFVMAALAGTPLIPFFALRRGFRSYELFVGEPERLPHRPGRALITAAAQRVVASMQRTIAQDPTQWFDFEPAGRHG